jgi:sarcosine oxidase gamma subunit
VATQVVISIKCRIAKVKADLENPALPVGNAIRTEADNISALIRKSIGSKANACNLENVKSLTETI